MCFLGPEGLPLAIIEEDPPEGEGTELLGAGVPGRLGEGSIPLLFVPVPPTADEEEEIPATLLTVSLVEATPVAEVTEATPTLPEAQAPSSFLEP